jgi:hypothetical protein
MARRETARCAEAQTNYRCTSPPAKGPAETNADTDAADFGERAGIAWCARFGDCDCRPETNAAQLGEIWAEIAGCQCGSRWITEWLRWRKEVPSAESS